MKLFFVCFMITLLGAYGFQKEDVSAEKTVVYRCPPCGCDHDGLLFHEEGLCPRCSMQLVESPIGFSKKIDEELSPFLETGMLGQVYTKLIYPVFAIGILLSLFFLISSVRRRSLNVFLASVILILSLYGFKNQLYGVNYGLTNSYKSLFTPISFILMLGPLVFFYIKSLTVNSFKWNKYYWLHFLPGGVMFLYYTILLLAPEATKQLFMFSPFEVRLSHFEQFLSVFLGLIYVFQAYRCFKQWKTENVIKNIKLTTWIFRFLSGLTMLFLSWAVIIFLNFWIYDFGVATVSYNPLWLIFGMVLLWLGIEIFSNSKFFLLHKKINRFNGNPSMTTEVVSHLKNELHSLMEDQKLYTDVNLSLDTLATALELNPKQLSMVLNNVLGKNFYDFVNHYRVKEVKERLKDLSSRNLTIEAIANQAGFKSKSSFNAAFKKQVHMTPREFMRQERNTS